jgi:hypothetical protein
MRRLRLTTLGRSDRLAVIAKTFSMMKEIRSMRAKSLRDNKFFRDHGATLPILRNARA